MLQLRASSSSQLLGAFLSDKKKNKRQPCNWQQSQQIKRPVPTCVGSGHGDEDERFAKKSLLLLFITSGFLQSVLASIAYTKRPSSARNLRLVFSLSLFFLSGAGTRQRFS